MFNIGDKIKVIQNNSYSSHKIGEEGIIIKMRSIPKGKFGEFIITINTNGNNYSPEHYETDLQLYKQHYEIY